MKKRLIPKGQKDYKVPRGVAALRSYDTLRDLGFEFNENGKISSSTNPLGDKEVVITPGPKSIDDLPKGNVSIYREGKQDNGEINLPGVTITAEQPKSYMGIPSHVYSSPLYQRMSEDRDKAGRDIALGMAAVAAAPYVIPNIGVIGEALLNPGSAVDKAALKLTPKLVTRYSKPIFGATTTPGMLTNSATASSFTADALLRLHESNVNLKEYPGLMLSLLPFFALPTEGFTMLNNLLMRSRISLILGHSPAVKDEWVPEAYKNMINIRNSLTQENYDNLIKQIGIVDTKNYTQDILRELRSNPTKENIATLRGRDLISPYSIGGSDLKYYHRMLNENLTDELIEDEIERIQNLKKQLMSTKGFDESYSTINYKGKPYNLAALDDEEAYLDQILYMRDNPELFTDKSRDIIGFDELNPNSFWEDLREMLGKEKAPGRMLGFEKSGPHSHGNLSTSSAPFYFMKTLQGLQNGLINGVVPTLYFKLNNLGRHWYMRGNHPHLDIDGSHKLEWLTNEEYVDKVLNPWIQKLRKAGVELLDASVSESGDIMIPYYNIMFKKGGRLFKRNNLFKK